MSRLTGSDSFTTNGLCYSIGVWDHHVPTLSTTDSLRIADSILKGEQRFAEYLGKLAKGFKVGPHSWFHTLKGLESTNLETESLAKLGTGPFSHDVSKLGEDIAAFSTLAVLTCRNCLIASLCYAMSMVTKAGVWVSHLRNTILLRRAIAGDAKAIEYFVTAVLGLEPGSTLRLYVAGDCEDAGTAAFWHALSMLRSDVQWYAYTKRPESWAEGFKATGRLSRIVINLSSHRSGGESNAWYMRNYPEIFIREYRIVSRVPTGAFRCPETCAECSRGGVQACADRDNREPIYNQPHGSKATKFADDPALVDLVC